MRLTKNYVEKLIAVRDAYEREKGPDDDMDKLVRDTLIKLFMYANQHGDIPTVDWCHEQLANERRRTALHPESLIPSGMVEPRRSYTLQEYLQYLQDLQNEIRFQQGERRHHSRNEEHESEMVPRLNPFNNRPSLEQDFVPPAAMAAAARAAAARAAFASAAAAPNRNANRRRGGKTHMHRHNKKGNKSIRRGKH